MYNGESLDSITVIIFIVFFTIGNQQMIVMVKNKMVKLHALQYIYIYTHISKMNVVFLPENDVASINSAEFLVIPQ